MQRILFVEDEDFIKSLYKRQLSIAGFEIDTASTGQEGLTLAQKNKYDLLLLDIMLPDINGIEVLRIIRQNPIAVNKESIAIFLTNLGQEDVIKEGLNQGAVSYLIKAQFTPDEIVEEVIKVLAQVNQPT